MRWSKGTKKPIRHRPRRHREDADLMPDMQAAAIRAPHPIATGLLIAVGAGLLIFFGWAAVTRVDEVTKGEGRVIASGKNRVVQHLEGGIVTEIKVREGDIVEKNQILLRVENQDEEANYREKRLEYLGLLARAARLEAEATGKQKVDFPKEVTDEAPKLARGEAAAFKSRRASQRQELRTLELELEQRRQSLDEQKSLIKTLTEKVASMTSEVRAARAMVANRSMSRLELVRLERELADTAGRLRTERLKVPRIEASIREAADQVKERRRKQVAEIRDELNKTRTEARALAERVQALRFGVEQTEVRAPVRGTVKSLRVSTKGGVVKPGESLVEIVPLEDSLLVEARVRPSDIAFLRREQPALVKITAYDYSEYGGLEGKVVGISADTIEDPSKQSRETFYRIRVRTDRNFLQRRGEKLPIMPGMTAQVNIRTGEKSVLQYIFKPITKGVSGPGS